MWGVGFKADAMASGASDEDQEHRMLLASGASDAMASGASDEDQAAEPKPLKPNGP